MGMDIDTGDLMVWDDDLPENVIEMTSSDLTKKEIEDKRVDLGGSTRAAVEARNYRNLRRFVTKAQGRRK
jgi:hypothetical protein